MHFFTSVYYIFPPCLLLICIPISVTSLFVTCVFLSSSILSSSFSLNASLFSQKTFRFFPLFNTISFNLRGSTPFQGVIFYLWTDLNEICTAYIKLNSKIFLFVDFFYCRFHYGFREKLKF